MERVLERGIERLLEWVIDMTLDLDLARVQDRNLYRELEIIQKESFLVLDIDLDKLLNKVLKNNRYCLGLRNRMSVSHSLNNKYR